MNLNGLKNKVLQLAIQGKLVEQNPKDTPASVLLEEIRQKKELLIKEKKIKKENALPEIKDEEKPFELPNGWEWIRLGDFIRFIGGNQPAKSTFKYEYTDGYIRLIQIRDYKSDKHITFIPYEKAKKFCSKEDIMIGRYGPPIFQILRGIEGAYNVALMKADPIGGIERDYLYYLLKDPILLKKLEFLASRTCGQDGIDMNTLKSYVVGLPPKKEQLRIVSKLEFIYKIIDDLNDNKDKMLKGISNTRNKVLQLAIEGKLVKQEEDDEPASVLLERINSEKEQLIKEKKIKKENALPEIKDEEKPFELPNGWEWIRLGQIVQLLNGRAYKKHELLHEGKTPILRVGNFFTNQSWYYSDLDLDENKYCDKGDLLYAWSASFGPKIWNGDKVIYHYHIWKINVFDKLNKEYLYYMLLNDVNSIKNITNGSTMVHVTKEKMENRVFPIPPLEEQSRIVSKIDEIMNYLDELENNILE